jgi:transposase
MIAWLLQASGGKPVEIHVAIETPHGPIVEALLERGFDVYSINPKQLDRFRDRFTVAGAKDDSRDADVLAESLRTDMRAFRKLSIADPDIVELREWSRIDEELKVERVRLTNRLEHQLWRYYPQMVELTDDAILSTKLPDEVYWLERAREAYAQAGRMAYPEARRHLLEIAAGYQRLAQSMEERTRRQKQIAS